MIARTWRGVVRREDAEAYLQYQLNEGLRDYRSTPGNRGVQVLYRHDAETTEVLMISLWDSLEAIRGFAGADLEKARFYPEDDRFLLDRDMRVKHYDVVWSDPAG